MRGDKLFNDRTRAMFATAKRRGVPSFTLAELRAALAEKLMRRPLCRYCGGTLSEANVSLDHKTPTARAGRNDLANVDFICKLDNKSKGEFTAEEYGALVEALSETGRRVRCPQMRGMVLTAMRVANSYRIGANRRSKKG